MTYRMQPIGILHTPFSDKKQTPIQASRSEVRGQVEVFPEFEAGLQDLEGFSHIILLYYFHQADVISLIVKPFLDDQQHGLFATRYPSRPNQIGLSIVELISCRAALLEIKGVDMLDGPPLLDIKPYVEEFDVRTGTRSGWLARD